MQFVPRLLVIPEIREDTYLLVQFVGPIWVIQTSGEDHQSWSIFLSDDSEPSLITHWQKQMQRIIRRISSASALVKAVDEKIRDSKLSAGYSFQLGRRLVITRFSANLTTHDFASLYVEVIPTTNPWNKSPGITLRCVRLWLLLQLPA
ncbi:hypothetical protein GO283_01617 [Ralstonia solanacearum]|nr:hypothetical protein [Ralstonia solanacearum]NKA93088.1 hypothetical protein [Ralstonia solanacearum]